MLFLPLFLRCLCIIVVINKSVQQYNGGLLPEIMLLTVCYLILALGKNSFESREEFLYFAAYFPP